MRKFLPLVLLISLLTIYCGKKDYIEPDDLNGQWKLVEVFDKSDDRSYGPPDGAKGKVVIRFSGTSFSGKTLKNDYSNGQFTLRNGRELLVSSFDFSNNTEDDWGVVYLFMLQACDLQSVFPCKPSIITMPKRRQIRIDTPLKYILTFEKS